MSFVWLVKSNIFYSYPSSSMLISNADDMGGKGDSELLHCSWLLIFMSKLLIYYLIYSDIKTFVSMQHLSNPKAPYSKSVIKCISCIKHVILICCINGQESFLSEKVFNNPAGEVRKNDGAWNLQIIKWN